MVQNANASNDLTHLINSVKHIGWITINLLAAGHLGAGSYSHRLAIFKDNLIDWLVQHVGASVNCAQTRETLRQLAQAVKRIQVRTLAIANQRLAVQLHAINQIQAGVLQVTLVGK